MKKKAIIALLGLLVVNVGLHSSRRSPSASMSGIHLPNEIIFTIFLNADEETIKKTSKTSLQMYEILNSEAFIKAYGRSLKKLTIGPLEMNTIARDKLLLKLNKVRKKYNRVTELRLKNCKIDNEKLKIIFNQLPRVRKVTIKKCDGVKKDTFEIISNAKVKSVRVIGRGGRTIRSANRKANQKELGDLFNKFQVGLSNGTLMPLTKNQSLTEVSIEGCANVSNSLVESLGGQLTLLSIKRCMNIVNPNLRKFINLKTLQIENMKDISLNMLLDVTENLETLVINRCYLALAEDQALQLFEKFKKLISLDLSGNNIPGIHSDHQTYPNFFEKFFRSILKLPSLARISLNGWFITRKKIFTMLLEAGYADRLLTFNVNMADITKEECSLLKKFTRIEELTCRGIDNEEFFKGISKLPLKSLTLDTLVSWKIKDTSVFDLLPVSLVYLSIDPQLLFPYSCLTRLTNLEELHIPGPHETGVAKISDRIIGKLSKKLKVLILENCCSNITGKHLERFEHLEKLKISGDFPHLTNINGILKLTRLRKIWLNEVNLSTFFTQYSKLSYLPTSLRFIFLRKVEGISAKNMNYYISKRFKDINDEVMIVSDFGVRIIGHGFEGERFVE